MLHFGDGRVGWHRRKNVYFDVSTGNFAQGDDAGLIFTGINIRGRAQRELTRTRGGGKGEEEEEGWS